AKADVEAQAGVALGLRDGVFDTLLEPARPRFDVAEVAQPDVVPVEVLELAAKEAVEEPDNRVHFRLGAAPVLGAEGVDGQVLDAMVGEAFDHAADVFGAGAMAGGAGEAPLACPAPIAIHDDGDVP